MMRLIKFRGKCHGTWYKGNLIHHEISSGIVYSISSFESPNIENLVESHTIGQYTGLKDKNNVEIYEGDILDVDNYKVYVNWNSTDSSFSLFQPTGHKSNVTLDITTSMLYEVVGNLYDNLNLLELIDSDTTEHPDL